MSFRNAFGHLALPVGRFLERPQAPPSNVGVFFGVLFVVALLAQAGPTFGGTYWPVSGLLLGLLLCLPRSRWPLVLGAGSLALVLSSLAFTSGSLSSAAVLVLVNVIEALLGAAVWRWIDRMLESTDTPIRLVTALSTTSALTPLVGATVACLLLPSPHPEARFSETWIRWWFADVIGILSITPLAVSWFGREATTLPKAYGGRFVEGVLLVSALSVFLVASFATGRESLLLNVKFFVLPLLMIVAFRFGPRGITIALFPLTLFSVAVVSPAFSAGWGTEASRFEAILHGQVYLFAVHVCFYFLAVLAAEKEATYKQLQRLTSLSPVGIFFRDAEGRVNYRNHTLAGILDGVSTQVGGEAARALGLFTTPCAVELGREPGVRRAEFLVPSADPALAGRWVECHSTPVLSDSGHLLGEVGAVVDLTFQKDIQRELERAHAMEKDLRQNAEKMARMREEFLSLISHELATPITAILGSAQMLASGHLAPERRAKAVDTILRRAHEESRLIGELLDFSRILASRLELRLATFELGTTVQAAVQGMRNALKSKGMIVEVDMPPWAVFVHGDEGRMRQVVSNLLSNAVKFSEIGDRVTISVDHRLKEATIRVRDGGKGIAPDFLPNVFDVFSQEDASLTRRQGGLGLGMAIARRIVELHSGTIEARSEGLGKGAEFTVKLPTENDTAPREYDEVLLDPALRPSDKLAGLRIMVVDDDPDCLDILSSWLLSQGADVQSFSEARDAYLQVVGLQPHVVLSDLSMPHIDGITFIEKLVNTRHYGEHNILIAAVTAFGDEQKRREALSKGFNGYFVKPYRFCDLLDWLMKQKATLASAGVTFESAGARAAAQSPTRETSTETMHL